MRQCQVIGWIILILSALAFIVSLADLKRGHPRAPLANAVGLVLLAAGLAVLATPAALEWTR